MGWNFSRGMQKKNAKRAKVVGSVFKNKRNPVFKAHVT